MKNQFGQTLRGCAVVSSFGLVILAAACAHNNGPGTTMTTGAPGISNQTAAERLARARCDREDACNTLGNGHTYVTLDDCMIDLRQKEGDDLKPEACPSGVDQGQLDKCLTEIRDEHCDNPLDSLDRLAVCRTGSLCAR